MTASILDTARAMYEAWNEGNVDRMIDFWTEDDDWHWEDAPDFPGGKSITGRAAVEAHLREVMSLLGSLQIEVEEMTEIDGEVLAVILWRIRGAQSGVELEDRAAHLVDFENGRVRRFRLFRDREQALEAANGPG